MTAELPLATSLLEVMVSLIVTGVVALSLTPSRVENIRVSCFVINGFFLGMSFDCAVEGSRCVVAMLLAARSSVLGNTLTVWLAIGLELEDRETNEPTDIVFSVTIRGLIAAMVRLDERNTVGEAPSRKEQKFIGKRVCDECRG